jgi:hypothetical protein
VRLARLLTALWLCAATAFAAAVPPACADEASGAADPCCAEGGTPTDAPGAEQDGEDEHGAGCELGCAACACCRPPVAPSGRGAAAASGSAVGRVQVATAAPQGAGDAGEIFQPPRA